MLTGCKTPSILVTEEQRKGDLCSNRHDYEQAVVHYRNVLTASMKLGVYRNLDVEADVCRKIGYAHSMLGNFNQSVDYLYQALEKDSIQGNELEIIEDYRDLGKLHLFLGDVPAGTTCLERVLAMNEKMTAGRKGINQLSYADTYLTLSRLYTVTGILQEAEPYGLEAMKIYRSMNDRMGEMESMLQLGKISIQLGDGTGGEKYVLSSLEMAHDLDVGTYRHYQTLALLNENQSRYEEALRLKLKSIEEVIHSNNLPQIIWSHMLTGDLYEVIGDRVRAREYYRTANDYIDSSQINARALEASSQLRAGDLDQAHAYFSEAGLEVAAGISGMRLGELALEWGLADEALGHFLNSFEHFRRTGLKDGMARSCTMLGLTYVKQKEYVNARERLSMAEDLVQYEESRWQMWFALGQYHEALSQPDSAIMAYSLSVEAIERIRGNFTVEEFKSLYLEDKMEVYNHLIRLLMEQGYVNDALHYAEKARSRAFLDMIGNNRIRLSGGKASELSRLEQDLRLEIQSLSTLLQKYDSGLTRGMGRQHIENQVNSIREEYIRVITQLKLFHPEYASMINLETADISTLTEGMDPSTAFLVYWVGPDELYIWLVSGAGVTGRTVPLDEGQVDDLVWKSRNSVGSIKHRTHYSTAYRQLIAPFENELSDFSKLGIIPHLSLHFLPFQCLMADSSTYLIEDFDLFYSPSLSVYAISDQKKINPGKQFLALALGGLELGGLPAIPGTTAEVSRISMIFKDPTVTYGNSSTETLFKSMVEPFEMVHLATHGILNSSQPMFSYMLLAPSEEDDGLLTVNEIFGLILNANMVVLSACETGMGTVSNGDEIIGLSRAFLFAGAQNVIVSLWSVADEPTAYLMTRFYSHLGENVPLHALKLAQLETREKYGNPVYWAPFQLIGTAK